MTVSGGAHPEPVQVHFTLDPGLPRLITISWQRGWPVFPWTMMSLLCSIKWAFIHRGPLAKTCSFISSVLGCLDDPKQDGSLIWIAISPDCPSLLAVCRVAVVNALIGPQLTPGSPLIGNRV